MPRYTNRKYKQLDIVNGKFVAVCEQLIASGVSTGKQDLAERLDMKPNVLYDLMNGKDTRNVTIDIVINLCGKFNVNPSFLFPPWSNEMFLKSDIKKLIKLKKKEIKDLEEEIRLLENSK